MDGGPLQFWAYVMDDARFLGCTVSGRHFLDALAVPPLALVLIRCLYAYSWTFELTWTHLSKFGMA